MIEPATAMVCRILQRFRTAVGLSPPKARITGVYMDEPPAPATRGYRDESIDVRTRRPKR